MSLPLVVIVGPTAVGKTQLAIELAKEMHGEIVSADSRQIYRGMNIGTAKPSASQQVQIQHHLIDICQPDQTISITEFQAMASRIIEQIRARSRLPIVVGGSGQYVHALIYQWTVPQIAPDHRRRADLETISGLYGPSIIYRELIEKDFDKSKRLDWRNIRRVIRALEVASIQVSPKNPDSTKILGHFNAHLVGLTRPRADLYTRIDERIGAMLEQGLVEEVRHLLRLGYSPTLSSMSSVGYAQVCAYIRGEIKLDDVATSMRRDTRRLVRKQYNWFSLSDPRIHWYDLAAVNTAQILKDLGAWLGAV